MSAQLARQRFIDTYRIVSREKRHLHYSCEKLFATELSTQNLTNLDSDPELAETIEAFASRFGRMQDTLAGKLFPRFLQAQAEPTGTQLETLHRMEKLGLVDNVEHWLEARELRNKLVHEYVEHMIEFKESLELARSFVDMLSAAHEKVGKHACQSLDIELSELTG